MLNRAAVILRYKEPAVEWINSVEPGDGDEQITLEEVNQERTVYLISDQDAEADTTLERWIEAGYAELFEVELEGWYTDESLWPQERTLKLFHEWFEVECHSVIVDTVGTPIVDEDL